MQEKWEDLTPVQKREARFNSWLSPQGIAFQDDKAEAHYREAVTRLKDAVLMEKIPDRVPLFPLGTFMYNQLYGVSALDSMYDYEKLVACHRRFLEDFQPDFYGSPAFIGSGKILEILDCKNYRWPGHGVSEASGYQCLEGEYMLAEDYPALIEDPTDWWLRTYLPRVFGRLAGLTQIAPFTNLWEIVGVSGQMIPFGTPPVQTALNALLDAGKEASVWIQSLGAFNNTARSMGFPSCTGGASKAPFDILADTLRGSRGIMLDMYRRPDMILEAVERLLPIYIKQGVRMATGSGNPIVFIPLHKGADGFMSDEQFKTFYWPTLKGLILGLAEEGCVPLLFAEGGYNDRLAYLKELPKGSCFWLFDRTDMLAAKQAIGDTLCIGGNVPASLILTSTAEAVSDYCKNLIDTVGPGGGYIMSFGTSMDEARADTVHAMIDTTKEYGVY